LTAGAPPGLTAAQGPFEGQTGGHERARIWTSGGDRESPMMHPGNACIACMRRPGARRRTGTPAVHHRRDGLSDRPRTGDCNGAPSATVEVNDATGGVTSLPPSTLRATSSPRRRSRRVPRPGGSERQAARDGGIAADPGRTSTAATRRTAANMAPGGFACLTPTVDSTATRRGDCAADLARIARDAVRSRPADAR